MMRSAPKLRVEAAPEGAAADHKVQELKAALRELGLPDDLEES
jgi:hypothetical protein